MAAALQAATAIDFTKPRRIEGHTSNVEHPILYSSYGTVTLPTTEAGDTYVIPHKISNPKMIKLAPTNAAGAIMLYGDGTTVGSWTPLTGSAVGFEAVGATALQGATSLTLGSSASALADVYNEAWLDVMFDDGTVQTVQITDYAVTTKIATLSEGLAEAVTATCQYRVRGSLLTIPTVATTPSFMVEVVGSFE